MTDIEFLDNLEYHARCRIEDSGKGASVLLEGADRERFDRIRAFKSRHQSEYIIAEFLLNEIPVIRNEILRQSILRLTS